MRLTIKDFIPLFIAATFFVVVLPVYLFTSETIMLQKVLQCFAILLIPLIVPVLSLIFKKRLSLTLNMVITLFSVATILFGGALSFYERFYGYDKVAHTIFGTVGAFITVIFLIYIGADNLPSGAKVVLVLLSVLGMAAIWEIYEYLYCVGFGVNVQGWLPDLENYGDMTVREFFEFYRPLWDTMWDIIVAAIGVGIYYIIMGIDKLTGSKLMNFIKKEIEE